MVKAVFFDLDGTLLPMDQDLFVKDYFTRMAAYLAPMGYEPKTLLKAIGNGMTAMVGNDGSQTNEDAFWWEFSAVFGPKSLEDGSILLEFYKTEFQKVAGSCGFDPRAAQTVRTLRSAGYRTVLATNPLFPAIATYSRARWAGLEPEQDFEWITTYENSGFCKPNPDYFREILGKLDLKPQDCLMVGNDATEDLAALETGMDVFVLTDCLINRENKDLSLYPHGSFPELLNYLGSLSK